MRHANDRSQTDRSRRHSRAAERRALQVPARLMWRDAKGATRFAAVVTRDVSEQGVFVECQTPVSISLFHLVQLQIDRDARAIDELPPSLREGRVLSAVYRVDRCRPSAGSPEGYALRLLVEPQRRTQVTAAPAAVAS